MAAVTSGANQECRQSTWFQVFSAPALSSAKKSPGNEFDRQDMLHQTSDLIGL